MRNAILSFVSIMFILNQTYAQDFEWAKQMGGSAIDVANSIAIDSLGNVYTTGYFYGTADFDPGSGTHYLSSTGISDIFIQKLDLNGNLIWVKRMGGTSCDAGNAIAIDGLGNIYTVGCFMNTVDFDPGNSVYNLTSVAGSKDIFIQKLDANGNFIWAKKMGGNYYDIIHSLVINSSGNIYTTGTFYGTADFDPGSGVYNLTSAGENDIFIQKLDNNGNNIWAKRIGGTSYDRGNSIALDDLGNVYTTGYFSDTVDFDTGSGTYTLISTLGQKDLFIQKLDSNGAFLWANGNGIGVSYDEFESFIAIDGVGDIYTTGRFKSTVDFDPGSGTFNMTSLGLSDIFIQKVDFNGNFIWAKQMGGVGEDYGLSIAIDGLGNIYTTGYFNGSADFDPGSSTFNMTSLGLGDIFIQKINANGNFIWAKQMGGSNYDFGYSIAIDGLGNIITAGTFKYVADFDPGSNVYNLTSAGDSDIFLQKLSQQFIGFTTSQSTFTSPPFNVIFNNTSNGYHNFLWDFGDGGTSNLKNPTHIYIYNGSYTVKLLATDTIGNYTDTVYATISCSGGSSYPLPPTFSTSQSTFIAPPFNVVFTNTSSGYNSFFWKFGDGDISSLENPTHLYISNGLYTVWFIASDTVSNLSDSVSSIISCAGLGINVVKSNGISMMIYPNPNSGNFIFEVKSTKNKPQAFQLEVYSIEGRLVYQEKIPAVNSLKKQMNFEGLSKGIYYLRLHTEANMMMMLSFVVE